MQEAEYKDNSERNQIEESRPTKRKVATSKRGVVKEEHAI